MKATIRKRGTKIIAGIELVKDLENEGSNSNNCLRFYSKFNFALPISNRFTLIPSVYTGFVKGDSIARQYYLYCGGMNNSDFNPGAFPFIGLQFMELSVRSVLLCGLNLQWQIGKNHYVTFRSNIGNTARLYPNLFTTNSLINGFGISYGYNSLVGPLEFSLMHTEETEKYMTYINIGYWF